MTMTMSDPANEIVSEEIESKTKLVLPTWRLASLCVSLCLGLFLSLLDTSIVATALYTIGDELDDLTSITWVALAYTLAYVGCAVIFTSIGDVFGRRNTYVAAFVIFFCFSLGCGFSQSLTQLIACRAFQGVGGSGLYSLAMVIFPEITTLEMGKWIAGFVGIVIAVSGVLGPVLGGLFTRYTSWRWIFWFNGPVSFFSLALFLVSWPKVDQIPYVQRRPFGGLDFVGCFFLVSASVLVVFSFQEGGLGVNTWSTPIFIAPLLIGCFCWFLLVAWEVNIARRWPASVSGIFPQRLLKQRVYMAGMLSTLGLGFPYFVVIYNLPLRFQVVNGESALLAGVGLLPMLGSSAVGSMLGGVISAKRNNTFPTLFVGSSLMAMGTGLLSTLSNNPKVELKTYGFQVFVGLGFGLTVSTVSILGSVECEFRDRAIAQGIIAQARIFGGSIGIAAATAILGVTERRQLKGIVSKSQLESLQTAARTLSPAQLEAVRGAYSDAFSESLRVCAAIACVCVLLTLGTFRRHPLSLQDIRKQQESAEAERQLEMSRVEDKQKS